MVFPKKLHCHIIFLVLSGKMVFLYPENIFLFYRQKMKYDLSHKIYENMIFSANVLKWWSFEKNCTGIWSLLYYQERSYFFYMKIWSYSLDRKWKIVSLKNYKFCIFGKDGISFSNKYDITFLSNKERWSSKNTLKDDISGIIEKDDIYPRKYRIFSNMTIIDDKKVSSIKLA